MMSPSATTYALPSWRYLPAALTSAMDLEVARLEAVQQAEGATGGSSGSGRGFEYWFTSWAGSGLPGMSLITKEIQILQPSCKHTPTRH